MHDAEGRHAVRFDVLAKRWGFAPQSSSAAQTVGALRQYGLLEVEKGTGFDRSFRLTDRALRILLDKRPGERTKALQDAAKAPKLYGDLWEKWGGGLPSDENGQSHLTIDRGFNPGVVGVLLANYKETLRVASLLGTDTLPDDGPDKNGVSETEQDEMDVVPEQERVVATARAVPPIRSAVSAGEEEHFRIKLAGGRTVRVLFHGDPPTQAEIEKLIKLLELQKDQYPPAI
ncbi:MAG TPA: hypothetical protein VK841_22685 [Polyangiaceae bacterium]|nr:hypothetical protein [Polyangiaceae bacterium]